jgi:hypothetical protein
MVGNPGVEPGSSRSQGERVTVSLTPGGEGRNRTGSAALAGRARCLTCHPQGRRAPDNPVKRTGRGGIAAGLDACRYGAHAMEVSIVEPARRRARTAGIEPAHAALETAVLPLNYVPRGKKVKKNRSSGIPESGSCQSPYRRYTGTCSLPKAREMPSRVHMVARLGRNHR